MYIYNQIQKLKLDGKNVTQISSELKLDWKTVKKYFNSETPPQSVVRNHKTRKDPLDGFYDKINQLVKINGLSIWDIYNELVNNNYLGSYPTVRRYIKKLDLNKNKERFFELTYKPGEELQVDFKEQLEVQFKQKKVFVHLFFGTLPYSSKVFVKAFPGLNFECFSNGLASNFEFIQGIPSRVRQDNLKPCVSAILKGKSRIYTEKYNKFIEYYDYQVSPCNPARGNEKGHVERDIQTFTHRIKSRLKIEEKQFENFEELNVWIQETVSQMQMPIEEKFLEEKKSLKVLRPRRTDLESHTVTVTGSKYGTVRYGKSVYSIPDSMIDENITLTATAYLINIFNFYSGKLTTSHPRLKDGSESILIEHVIQSLLRKPAALLHWKHKSIIFNDPMLHEFYLILKKQDIYNCEKKLLQVLNLIQFSSLNEIKASIELWLENQLQPPFEFIRSLIIEERRPNSNLIDQQKINPDLKLYDQILISEDKELIKSTSHSKQVKDQHNHTLH